MIAAGTIKLGFTKDIRKKISDYVDKFKYTYAWVTATSAGVRENERKVAFNDTATNKLNTT